MTTLNQEQKDLIFGTLLGDGNLQTETGGRTWRYRALQQATHKEYLVHKYSKLQDLCSSAPVFGSTFDPRTGNTYQRWSFNTTIQSSLNFYANMFYRYDPVLNKFVKDVPTNVKRFLTPRALAYLYMDDGALKAIGTSNAMRICTESFTLAGVTRLKKALEERHGIVTTLSKQFKVVNGVRTVVGYRLYIPERSSTAFRELIKPHLVTCMRYKVSDGNRGHL